MTASLEPYPLLEEPCCPAIFRVIRVQGRKTRVYFGTKNDAAGYTLPRRFDRIRVKCDAGQSATSVSHRNTKGYLSVSRFDQGIHTLTLL